MKKISPDWFIFLLYIALMATKTEGRVLTVFALNKDTLVRKMVLNINNLAGKLTSNLPPVSVSVFRFWLAAKGK